MGNALSTNETDSLRYLEANAVRCSAGTLEGLSIFSQDDEAMGAINVVLIHPATRQVRYFVVELPQLLKRRRYLVRADMPAVVVPDDRALRFEVPSEDIEEQRFDSRTVSHFSD